MAFSFAGLPSPTPEELTSGNQAIESVGEGEDLEFCAAGFGYFALLRGDFRLLNLLASSEASGTDPEEEGEEEEGDSQKYAHRKKQIGEGSSGSSSILAFSDPYEALGLGELRWRATESQLKQAYHTAAFNAHPDRNGGDNSAFKALGEMWELLNTEKKRRAFDSADPRFDDSIPEASGVLPAEEFFALYGPAFARNEHWSTTTVPVQLGDASTPWSQVDKFYNWWRTKFHSWREFSTDDEYDPETAESREERRWMERQNKKRQQQRKNQESSRLVRLVENAYRADPRVAENLRVVKQQRAEARKAQLELVKARRQAQLQAQQEREAEQRALRELQAAEREAQAAAARRQAQLLEDLRQDLRRRARSFPQGIFAAEHLESICLRFTSTDELAALLEQMATAEDRGLALLRSHWEELDQSHRSTQRARQQAEEEAAARDKDAWTPDELSMLAQALIKYPGGYPNRWDKVAELLSTKTKRQIITKTKQLQEARPDEVIKANQEEASRAAFERFQATKKTAKRDISAGLSYSKEAYDVMIQHEAAARKGPWSLTEQEQFETGIREVPADSTDRWDLIAKYVPTRTVTQIQQRYRLCWLLVNKPAQGQAIIEKRKAQWQEQQMQSTAASSSGST